jgi:hypothetical protein
MHAEFEDDERDVLINKDGKPAEKKSCIPKIKMTRESWVLLFYSIGMLVSAVGNSIFFSSRHHHAS